MNAHPKAGSDAEEDHRCLLCLPGEIRNSIYEYALTYANGLIHREVDGTKRLYLSPPSPERGSQVSSKRRKREEPELWKEANQLKYVNRQLYAETRRLALQYNDIVFHYANVYLAMENASKFVKELSPVLAATIRQLTIKFDLSEYKDNASEWDQKQKEAIVLGLFRFCDHYPSSTIKIRSYFVLQNEWDFVVEFSRLAAITRHDKVMSMIKRATSGVPWLEHNLASYVTTKFEEVRTRESKEGKKGIFAPLNFRIFPLNERFDEGVYRKAVEDAVAKDHRPRAVISQLDGGVDRWVEMARVVYDNGV
jgi:hypothetical protein